MTTFAIPQNRIFAPASTGWFACHEVTLAWRRWLSILAGGRKHKSIYIACGTLCVVALLHYFAYYVLTAATVNLDMTQQLLILVSGCLILSFAMMLSQSLESVTRAFYTRDDLDLLLSSPASSSKIFSVRIAAIALSSTAMTGLLASPLINTLAFTQGAEWLSAYIVLFAMAALSTALSVLITIGLFNTIGARKTRLIAQIVAATIGALFVVGIQVAAILSLGEYARFALLEAEWFVAAMPDMTSYVWYPAHAVMGNAIAAVALLVFGVAVLASVIRFTAPQFGELSVKAASVSFGHTRTAPPTRSTFKLGSQRQALRRKEWQLLGRDPWLVSQSLMQIFYLLPPALILWISHGAQTDTHVIITPVLVMAIGQLAGGLAWLAISGEDAPDLIASAPLAPKQVQRAKVEAVLLLLAALAAPFILAIAVLSLKGAMILCVGLFVSAYSAIKIQLWFQSNAKRSNFRRRQTASRMATFAEAFSSILWAAATGIYAAGYILAVIPAVLALFVLCIARAFRKK